MANAQNFIDNLKNLRLVTSVALEHVQENRDQFSREATEITVRQIKRTNNEIRMLAEQLEREFNTL